MTMLVYLTETQVHVVTLLAPERPRESGQLPGETGGPGLPGLPGFQTSCLSGVSPSSGLRAQGQALLIVKLVPLFSPPLRLCGCLSLL